MTGVALLGGTQTVLGVRWRSSLVLTVLTDSVSLALGTVEVVPTATGSTFSAGVLRTGRSCSSNSVLTGAVLGGASGVATGSVVPCGVGGP